MRTWKNRKALEAEMDKPVPMEEQFRRIRRRQTEVGAGEERRVWGAIRAVTREHDLILTRSRARGDQRVYR